MAAGIFFISDPGTGGTKPQKFEVSGTSDAMDMTPVTCTITKGGFNETGNGVVMGRVWTVSLGNLNPIPVGSDYSITARPTSGSGSDGVDAIVIVERLLVEIGEIDPEPVPGDDGKQILTITGKVAANPPFNELHVSVHAHGQRKGFKVVSAGWIKPIPANLQWRIKLEAPTRGHNVIHVLGVKTGQADGGKVLAHVTKAKR